jgi:hypothetical protein
MLERALVCLSMTLHSVLKTLLVIGASSVASAAVVDFNTFSPIGTCIPTISTGGLDFSAGSSFCQGVWNSNPNGNGTPALVLGFTGQTSISQTGGGAFDLNSFMMAISWYETAVTSTVGVTAHFQGGGTSVQTLTLLPTLQTYNLNLLNVSQVDVTVMSTGGGYWVMDNVNFNANASSVPEPASFGLVAAGMMAAAFYRKRIR